MLHWISGDSRRRFVLSFGAAALAYFTLPRGLTTPARAIATWDTFAFCAILLAWVAITVTTEAGVRFHARAQDLSRLFIFGFVVTAACVALLSVAFVIRGHQAESRSMLTEQVILGLGTVALCWLLLHTVFSLHYAHVYYGDADDNRTIDGGLEFPTNQNNRDEPPDYLDFAYFSFVVGMTCQVSDVQVCSKRMRQLTLIHGVISFGFNTFILALLINTISGLL
jgi:uncharacterized membrane protein